MKSLKALTILLRASHSVEALIKKDIANYDLNTAEFGTLELLFHKGPTPLQDICSKLLMASSSMTYVIDKLEKKNYVRRVQDKTDRRITNIELTKSGRDYIESIFPNHEKRVNEIFSVLNDEEVDSLLLYLKKLGKQEN
jgi:MarR family 2-MHQ and catechol resistance regulon transcriptional repressor